jgi:hypothetical protein
MPLPVPLSRLVALRLPIAARFVFIQNIDEFSRIEHLATRLAFNKLDVLLASDDADLRMFARCRHMGELGLAKSLPSPHPLVNRELVGMDVFFDLVQTAGTSARGAGVHAAYYSFAQSPRCSGTQK